MAQLTRGPLPPEVYWRRRLFVLTLAATLLFVIVSVLRGGSDGSSDEVPVAQQAGADVEPSQTVTVEPNDRKRERRARRTAPTYGPTFDPDVLAEPEGYCKADEVLVTPQVDDAVAGRDVTIGLSLRSTGPAACFWRLATDRIVVRITQGDKEIWTTRECGEAIPERVVTVRDVVATVVEMTWEEAKESDARCPTSSEWAAPGDYSIAAATFGGEPSEIDFELAKPTPETVTPDPEGEKTPQGEQGPQGQQTPGGEQTPQGEQAPQGEQTPQGDGTRTGDGKPDIPIR